MGVISETVRTWPGAVCSAHPQTLFAAVGLQAASLMAGHSLDCRLGEQSPLARLEGAKACVLLLGVCFGSCTAFHLAEYRMPAPVADISFAAITEEGRRWITMRDTSISDERFDEVGAAFEKERPVARGTISAAQAWLFPLADAVAYARKWLLVNGPMSLNISKNL